MPWQRIGRFALCFVLALLLGGVTGARAEELPRPASFESAIGFWRSVFGTYSRNQVLLHDNVHLDVVYQVLDFRPDEGWSFVDLAPTLLINEADLEAREFGADDPLVPRLEEPRGRIVQCAPELGEMVSE